MPGLEEAMTDGSPTAEQERALDLAKQAAASGDPKAMLEHLHRSHLMDGLVKRLERRWRQLPRPEVDFAVAQAVDVLYAKVSARKRVSDIDRFLFKVAFRRAYDYHRMRQREQLLDTDKMDQIPGAAGRVLCGEGTEDDRRAEKRGKAIALARRLLPKLGQETIRSVMSYVLEAVEAGREDVPNKELAEALGLTLGAVKTSLSRAFARLARLAREEGLTERELKDIVELETDDVEGAE